MKPVGEFAKDKSRGSGLYPWCKSCQYGHARLPNDQRGALNGNVCPMCDEPIRGNHKRVYCSHRCRGKASKIRTRYGLTPDQFRALLPADGLCPICLRKAGVWHVDHNHNPPYQITGVVCASCNVGPLAHTYHDPAVIRRLLEYVEHPPALRLGIDTTARGPALDEATLHQTWRHKTYEPKADHGRTDRTAG